MRQIEFGCQNPGQLKIIGTRLHDGHDFAVQSNTINDIFDCLLFLDSRGISREFKNLLADKLISEIEKMGKTYLLVCRPLELTIWATLINFLKLNQLSPKKLLLMWGSLISRQKSNQYCRMPHCKLTQQWAKELCPPSLSKILFHREGR